MVCLNMRLCLAVSRLLEQRQEVGYHGAANFPDRHLTRKKKGRSGKFKNMKSTRTTDCRHFLLLRRSGKFGKDFSMPKRAATCVLEKTTTRHEAARKQAIELAGRTIAKFWKYNFMFKLSWSFVDRLFQHQLISVHVRFME